MKKLYNGYGEIRGYEYNNKYLLKHYTWGNKYSWIIADKDYIAIMSCEIGKLLDNGNIKFVDNFKIGMKELGLK